VWLLPLLHVGIHGECAASKRHMRGRAAAAAAAAAAGRDTEGMLLQAPTKGAAACMHSTTRDAAACRQTWMLLQANCQVQARCHLPYVCEAWEHALSMLCKGGESACCCGGLGERHQQLIQLLLELQQLGRWREYMGQVGAQDAR
jgi:hypothetical protein